MVVSCWLQTLDEGRAQEGSRPITHLPVSKEELFWYDVVLLFDPNPMEFDAPWMELLKQFVGDHAGGVLFMAGPKFTDTMLTSTRTRDLGDVLPVRFGDVRRNGRIELALHQQPILAAEGCQYGHGSPRDDLLCRSSTNAAAMGDVARDLLEFPLAGAKAHRAGAGGA